MIVNWYSEAQWHLDQIEDYIFDRFGLDSMEEFIDKVDQVVELILRHPSVGPIEPLLAERSLTYRSVVVGNLSKIIYRVQEETIHIVDFWDCRREPKALTREVESVNKQ